MESLLLMAKLCFYGIRDCLDGVRKIWNFRYLQGRKKGNKNFGFSVLLHQFLRIIGLNGVAFGLIIYIFYRHFLPTVEQFTGMCNGYFMQELLIPTLCFTFALLWTYPMFLASRVVNCVLFQDIADTSFEMANGPIQYKHNISFYLSDFFSAIVLQTLFLVQSCLVTLFPIPLVADILSFVLVCLLYSLYAFDYKWVNVGWPLNVRLAVIDVNWPYFVGFGTPLVLFTVMASTFVARICIFSVLFPFMVVSAMNTNPVMGDFKFRIKAFGPVMWLLNFLTRMGINHLHKPRKH